MQKSGSFASRRRGILMVIADVILWRTEMKLRAAQSRSGPRLPSLRRPHKRDNFLQSKPATTTYALSRGHVSTANRWRLRINSQ